MTFKSVLALLLLLSIVAATDTYLQLYSQRRKIAVKVSLANFGYFKFGHRLTGRVQLGVQFALWDDTVNANRIPLTGTNTTQTEPITKAKDLDLSGCKKDFQQFNEAYINQYGQPIYFVERGNCTFLRKATNAAKYGKMLIIADNSDQEDVNNIIMGDDLSGQTVMIPVVMVSKNEGALIREFLINEIYNNNVADEDSKVFASIAFYKPQEGEVANIQYWMIPSDRDSYKFLASHYKFLTSLLNNKHAVFEPHFVFFKCDETCQSNQNSTKIKEFCLFDGQFCHPDPDGNGPLNGADSVTQAVNELCIYNLYPQYFLDYFFHFYQCYVEQNNEFKSCHQNSADFVVNNNPDTQSKSFLYDVKECKKQNTINAPTLLSKEYELYNEQGIHFYPALFVNGEKFKGDLKLHEPAEEFICVGLENADKVEGCSEYISIVDEEDKWNINVGSDDSYLVLKICIVLFFVFIVSLFIYRRKVKMEVQKELAMQVDTAIQQYYALNESK